MLDLQRYNPRVINLVLTKECAKLCSFCFTGDYSKGTEMSLDYIDRFLTRFSSSLSYLNVLGGEPTQHRNFPQIIEKIEEHKINYTLISNLLFSQQTLEFILKNSQGRLGISANGMELFKKGNRFKVFKKNYNALYTAFKHIPEYSTLLSLTVDKNSTPESFKKYISTLKNELESLPFFRIGLDLSNTGIANNTLLGDIIRAIQEASPTSKILFDCQVPPCIFNYDPNKELYSFQGLSFSCPGPTLDVFYDGSAIHCYQAQKIKINNVFDFYTTRELENELTRQYKEREKTIDILEVCKSCAHYLEKRCASLCMGCYQKA
tara:strand:+ start:90 stop:1049 length:960 start_codon:yes stop_codon:yes gene_type:complete